MEHELYEAISNYLQRDQLIALPASQRALITLVLRKLLASSTFAIADTLERLAIRLEAMSSNPENLLDDEDLDLRRSGRTPGRVRRRGRREAGHPQDALQRLHEVRLPRPEVRFGLGAASRRWWRTTRKSRGKPWTYLLIPHDVITDNKAVRGLAATYAFQAGSARIGSGEVQTGHEAIRLVRVTPREVEKYCTCVPILTCKAAGAFSDPQRVEDDDWERVAIDATHRLGPGMFVAQVVGKSMEPAIPDGGCCLFAAPVEGTRQGKAVLVQLRDASDTEAGERYIVKHGRSPCQHPAAAAG